MVEIPDHPVIRIDRLDLRFVPKPWAFADEKRGEIDAYFAELKRGKPALWNGRVLVLHQHEIAGATLRGDYLETDFASFIAWRDWGFPDRAMRNCFAEAALLSADGAFLLGEMGAHTANAGLVYFPGGTPDPSDIADGRVDMEASAARELAEETGLAGTCVRADPHWFAILAEPRIALIKLFRSDENAVDLRARIRRHIAADPHPELANMLIARDRRDLDERMPSFVRAFLNWYWNENGEGTA
jgi:8-oxo-dGTP pyrophosphatase MutT (NUDIX family)